MRTQKLLSVSFLTLKLLLSSNTTLADEIPRPDFSCLTRQEKENIAVCFQENADCHLSLSKATSSPVQDDWSILLTAGLVGVIGGLVMAHQVEK